MQFGPERFQILPSNRFRPVAVIAENLILLSYFLHYCQLLTHGDGGNGGGHGDGDDDEEEEEEEDSDDDDDDVDDDDDE